MSEPLTLLRSDVDLKAGVAITRAANNKGGRDELVPLHPKVIELLKLIPGFTAEMFPWEKSSRGLYAEFERIQKAAGIKLVCDAPAQGRLHRDLPLLLVSRSSARFCNCDGRKARFSPFAKNDAS